MWRFDEYGEVSPELSSMIASVKLATLIGAGYGMYTESRRITKKFLDTHKHEMFKHPREAVASLQDQALLAYFKVIYLPYSEVFCYAICLLLPLYV